MMKVTVAICTWNRADLLDKTLERMQDLRISDGIAWEILVVNNNSPDHTDEVISRYVEHLPLRRLFEQKQGHSHARNCALENAYADWVLFTDDDVLVSEGWLQSYCNAIDTCESDIAFMGGSISPWFDEVPDESLVRAIPTVGAGFCGVTLRDNAEEILLGENALGANFAVRKSVSENLQFDTDLGLKAGQRIVGEETSFQAALRKMGFRGRWVHDAEVLHYVEPHRLTLSSLKRHLSDLGRTSIRTNGIPEGRSFLGITLWIPRSIFESRIAMLWFALIKDKYRYYKHFASTHLREGMLYEIIRQRFARRKKHECRIYNSADL